MGRGRAQKSNDLIAAAREILEEIHPASVRAVAYRLFVRNLISSMSKKSETNKVSHLLTEARKETTIPWEWIAQEGQDLEGDPGWDDPETFAEAITSEWKRNKWNGQPRHVIVLAEKGTVRGTLAPVLEEFSVQFLPLGGVASTTWARRLGQMIVVSEKQWLVIYLTDYDPSGRFMVYRDLPRRLFQYMSHDPTHNLTPEEVAARACVWEVEIQCLAVTRDDTRALGRRLSFHASDKRKDPHYRWFVEHYGQWCWELDAMNPNDLRARVREAIVAEIDQAKWDRYVIAEEAEHESIVATCRSWKSLLPA
jgi:hypothetical protein